MHYMDYSSIINIVVAAGSGSRFGGDMPKQYCELDGVPVLIHALMRLRKALPKSTCIVVVHPDYTEHVGRMTERYGMTDVLITTGGATRWESVKNAIDMADREGLEADVITVHDGARPLVTERVVRAVVAACADNSGAIPAIAVTDSLRRIDADDTRRSVAVDRSAYRAVQTPQAFQADKLRKAYTLPYRSSFTDDASVMAASGFDDIALVEGDARNIKITLPNDIDIASIYLKSLQ